VIVNTRIPHSSLTALATLLFGLGVAVIGGGSDASSMHSPAISILGRPSAAPHFHVTAEARGVFPARWPVAVSRDNSQQIRPLDQRTPFTRLMPVFTARPARKTSADAGTAYVSPAVPVRADRRADLAEMAINLRQTRRDRPDGRISSLPVRAPAP
jgi:hypothetical protein